ncbi:MAG: DUF4386 domain-containing protein [Actinomycetota bacterium]|nr:DUF4386 domain-containing protein [Actinomycetota bacterium]
MEAIGSTLGNVKRASHVVDRSPLDLARFAGFLYLVIAVLSGFVHFYVPGQLIVSGDAATTARSIMASEGLFRINIAAELIIVLSEVVLSVLLYVLLRPVSRALTLVMMVSRLTMTAIHGINILNNVVVLLLLSGVGYLTVFAPGQLHALVMLFLDAYRYGFQIGIAIFALHTAVLGYLIYRSGFFPRVLGILFMIAPVGYLVDSFGLVLVPGHTTGAVYLALPITIAEVAFPLWLLVKGVHVARWKQRALGAA